MNEKMQNSFSPRSTPKAGGKVYLIGAGPGDPGLLTLKGRWILGRADVVVYDYLASDGLLAFTRPEAELVYVGKKAGDHTLPQDDINRLIIEKAREGKVVARLKGGDPYMFGRGGEEAQELVEAGLDFEVVPGVTSAIAGPAYAGIPLTHRQYASSVTFITGHEDPNKTESVHNWDALAGSASTLVFFMGMKNLPDISSQLIQAGMPPERPAALVYWGTTPRHKSVAGTIADLPDLAVQHGFTNPSLIVVGDVVRLHDELNWFEKKPLLGKSVVVTRSREQASALADRLEELGAEAIQFPVISIQPLADYSALDAALKEAGRYDWLIATSANTVEILWRRLAALKLDSRALAGCRVAAIGPATAQALANRGITADFVPKAYVAESVVEGLLAYGVSGKRILLPRAAKARDVLPDELRKAGAAVDLLAAYETRPVQSCPANLQKRLEAREINCITFASSSTVENFFAAVPVDLVRQSGARLACIGPITAASLEALGLAPDIQPEAFTIPALVRTIEDFFTAGERPCR